MNVVEIRISDIDKADDRFRICYFPDLTSILLSIKKIGLVYPLVLTVRHGKKIIVCGWKRLLASEKLSFTEIPAVILNEKDDFQAFNIAVFENASFRKFDLLEKAEIISKWTGFNVGKNTVIKDFMTFLGIPPAMEYFDLFYSISGLDNDIKKELAHNRMDLKTLAVYMELDPSPRRTIIPLLLSLSKNKQKELLVNMVEITLKEDISSDKLFRSKNIQAIIKEEDLSIRQRAEKLSQHLKERRYPMLSSQLSRFTSLSKIIGVQRKNIDMKASDYFEEESMTFSFSVSSIHDYNKKIEFLTELAGKKELSELFKVLSNEDE